MGLLSSSHRAGWLKGRTELNLTSQANLIFEESGLILATDHRHTTFVL